MVAGDTFSRLASESTETLPARSNSWRIICARRSAGDASCDISMNIIHRLHGLVHEIRVICGLRLWRVDQLEDNSFLIMLTFAQLVGAVEHLFRRFFLA